VAGSGSASSVPAAQRKGEPNGVSVPARARRRDARRPADAAARPDWKAGDAIYFGRKTVRVVAVKDEDADQAPSLVVRDTAE
jgi:hypothetical protein